MKEFADDNFKFDENGRKLSKQVENTLGKGEIARYEQFLLFPQCFQKACFLEASKGVVVWEWDNPLPNDIQWNLVSSRCKGPVFFIRTKCNTYQKVWLCWDIFVDFLYDLIDIACLKVTSVWGLVPWIFSNIYGAKSQIQCSRYIWWFLRK